MQLISLSCHVFQAGIPSRRVAGGLQSHSWAQALSKWQDACARYQLLPLGSILTLQYMLNGSEQSSFEHLSFRVCRMLGFLSGGCWRDIAGRRGFSCCFWQQCGGSGGWVWGHPVEFCPKCAPRMRGPLPTFQPQPGLLMTFLRPTTCRNQLLKASCLSRCHNALYNLCPRPSAACLPVPPGHQLLTACTSLCSGGLLPVCPATADRLQLGWTNSLLSSGWTMLLNGVWTPALGRGPLSKFCLPWMPSLSSTIPDSVSWYLTVMHLSEFNNSLN